MLRVQPVRPLPTTAIIDVIFIPRRDMETACTRSRSQLGLTDLAIERIPDDVDFFLDARPDDVIRRAFREAVMDVHLLKSNGNQEMSALKQTEGSLCAVLPPSTVVRYGEYGPPPDTNQIELSQPQREDSIPHEGAAEGARCLDHDAGGPMQLRENYS